jgi:purine catabolism regulator
VLATAPASAAWPVEQILFATRHRSDVPTAIVCVPVCVEDVVVAYLCCRRPRHSADVIPYAVSLVGLEMARRQAELAGQRRLAGQVLEDLVRGTIGAPEASRRLSPFGIRDEDEHALLVATVSAADLRKRLVTSPPLSGATTALLEDCLIAVLEPGQSAHEAARLLEAYLARLGTDVRVGVGGWYSGMTGLRWSYYEAYEAMSRGPGINEREQMSLSGLLLASDDVPLRDLARDLLRPLCEFDAAHAGSLVATLRAYLDADGSVATVADRLIVHRNTVRYRIEQIERLTGRSLSRTADRVQLWLAVAAARLDS